MAFRFSCRLFALVALLTVWIPGHANAQGIFDKTSLPKTVIATGQTETLGMIELTLRQSSTAADTLTINVSPLRITNTSASDIRITTFGAITVGTTTIVADKGLVKIPVNAGATSGSIEIQGIRVAVAGTGITSVTANLSWDNGQNYFFASGTSGTVTTSAAVPVVNSVQTGLAVDPNTTNIVIYNNKVVKDTGTFVIHEGYPGAFVSGTDFGQDTPTQVQIRVSDMPAGLTLHFPASVTATETAATLTTTTGSAVDIASTGNSTVVYSYGSSTG